MSRFLLGTTCLVSGLYAAAASGLSLNAPPVEPSNSLVAEWTNVPGGTIPKDPNDGGSSKFGFRASGYPPPPPESGGVAGIVVQRVETIVNWTLCPPLTGSHDQTYTHYEVFAVVVGPGGDFVNEAGFDDTFESPPNLCPSEYYFEKRGEGYFIPLNDDTKGWLLDVWNDLENTAENDKKGGGSNRVRDPAPANAPSGSGPVVSFPLPNGTGETDSGGMRNSTEPPSSSDIPNDPNAMNWANGYGPHGKLISFYDDVGLPKSSGVFGDCCGLEKTVTPF